MYRRKRLSSATMSGSGYWRGCCPDQSRADGVDDTWGCCACACAGAQGLKAAAPRAAVRNALRFQEASESVFFIPALRSLRRRHVRVERIDGDLPSSIGLLFPDFDVLAVIHDRRAFGISHHELERSSRVADVSGVRDFHLGRLPF